MSSSVFFIVIVWLSLVVSYLTVRFWKYIAKLAVVLVATFILGFFALFFNLDLGLKMITYSMGLFVCGFLLHFVAGVVSAVFLTPLAMLWFALEGLFKKNKG